MAKKPVPVAASTPAVTITSRVAGFRRAGVAHDLGPTTWPAGFFTEAQLELLEDEPMLRVVEATAGETVEPEAS